MSIQIPASSEKQKKLLNIVHCIPVVRHEGRFYVFLWEKIENGQKIIQPFGGKSDPNETVFETLARELGEELEIHPETASILGYNMELLGEFSAQSDIDDSVMLNIHCYFARLREMIDFKASGEMSEGRWYGFDDVFELPDAGTLTKQMVATLGARYFVHSCIRYLKSSLQCERLFHDTRMRAISLLRSMPEASGKYILVPVDLRDAGVLDGIAYYLKVQNIPSDDISPSYVCYQSGRIIWFVSDGQLITSDSWLRDWYQHGHEPVKSIMLAHI